MARLMSLAIYRQTGARKGDLTFPGYPFEPCHIAAAQQRFVKKLNSRCLKTNPTHRGISKHE